ncbi:FadR/GntR family transcriptional regulator [Jonesia denitrificans]|uniref:Regulatory protein GntR HTH n=1 Tax=Jonesia denitrificans (strain ATCC 14870 / DSM 20603 / BCRC 15368 / CIP 55.134 / JCM 11481 / NBRC 15587 / NCTC 10816 / Prevot 55134) TaxID=471856 RepID=C7R059_JONDD|nr:GntR family transcriptional regulator [Jonesia denitrificans]ACV08118.1 regulatory protein GntR HTH [Jonesia denitrificans DSM 20603]ASE08205.1 FadR family transcriptional regulator [Jonesia denitrificans]QXB42804.1 GntR family transcriptional regulator [Jonesia denitrificans]SQH20099.1 Pyruvate dehydrogenase complex repressor [Jonesia denitrificans]
MQTYETVLSRIETGLAEGRWQLGDHLPSERALAEEFAVSRASIREALRVLEAMGIIRRGTGSGPDAGAILIDRPAAGLGAAIKLHLASGAMPVHDVVQMRLLIETWAAQNVAMRCAAESLHNQADATQPAQTCLTRALALLEDMEASALNHEEFQRLDAEFHVELVALAGNTLCEATMLGLRQAIADYVAAGSARLDDWQSLAHTLMNEHRHIISSLQEGDATGAATAVEQHIEGFYRRALGQRTT